MRNVKCYPTPHARRSRFAHILSMKSLLLLALLTTNAEAYVDRPRSLLIQYEGYLLPVCTMNISQTVDMDIGGPARTAQVVAGDAPRIQFSMTSSGSGCSRLPNFSWRFTFDGLPSARPGAFGIVPGGAKCVALELHSIDPYSGSRTKILNGQSFSIRMTNEFKPQFDFDAKYIPVTARDDPACTSTEGGTADARVTVTWSVM